MFRAARMFRWGGGSYLVGGLALIVIGLTMGDPLADRFSAVLGVLFLVGLAGLTWWTLVQLARVADAGTAEESPPRQIARIALLCAVPVVLAGNGALFPTGRTWLIGLCFAVAAVAQLALASRVASVERRHGVPVLRHPSRGFFFAR